MPFRTLEGTGRQIVGICELITVAWESGKGYKDLSGDCGTYLLRIVLGLDHCVLVDCARNGGLSDRLRLPGGF